MKFFVILNLRICNLFLICLSFFYFDLELDLVVMFNLLCRRIYSCIDFVRL